MILVNQGIWTSLPEKVKKGRAHNISYFMNGVGGGEKNLRWFDTVEVGYHVLNVIFLYNLYQKECSI